MSAKALIDLAPDFADLAKKGWSIYKTLAPAKEAAEGVTKSISMAAGALSNSSLGANNERLQDLCSRVSAMEGALSELARYDENYWILKSGENLFSRAAGGVAKQKISGWIDQLSALYKGIDVLLPLAKGFASVMDTSAAQTLDVVESGYTSLALLDTIAARDLVNDLNGCQTSIDRTLVKLRNCQKAVSR